MSISSITLTNFKGISSSVSIPLKPITLLFGANSAGKSTILQALIYRSVQ
ncbi:MAG: AAA family ATPase [Desulfamplus sp.]|nr:AAA family ATPase [Desulfamplus sp.]